MNTAEHLIYMEKRFHKKLIIPWEIAQAGKKDNDIIQKWKDTKEDVHFYKEGDSVCHGGNTSQIMYVSELVYGLQKPKKAETPKRIFIGLICHWWENPDLNESKTSSS